ncbi:MAG: SUF system Fe-S cluster assembly regulator [Rhodospirillales bacterium]
MIRLSRLADYSVVLMTYLASHAERPQSALDLTFASGLPGPTVGKLLNMLARAGLLTSYRGVGGGYALTRTPEDISVSEVIHAVDGPIALTECIHDASGECDLEASCPARGSWQVINDVVRRALSSVSLADVILAAPVAIRGGAFAAMGNTAELSVKEH